VLAVAPLDSARGTLYCHECLKDDEKGNMRKMRKAYKVFVGKPAVMRHYEDLDADGI
jgi:hypothetical protein